MITQELRMVKRQLRTFKAEIEKFEKRSKAITVIHKFEFYNRYYTQINITKQNKVVNEMIEYIKELCDITYTDPDGTMWLKNYDDLADVDTEDYSQPEYDVCIHTVK
jgi:hypothetical protein